MTRINETSLPGVGVRHDFETEAGDRIGVILHHSGRRDLLVYDQDDPDFCRSAIPLNESDSHSLAELLGAPQIETMNRTLAQSLGELTIDWIQIRDDWMCSGSTLRQLDFRARTGVSVIAVVRDEHVTSSPDADFVLTAGDIVVGIGTAAAMRGAVKELRGD